MEEHGKRIGGVAALFVNDYGKDPERAKAQSPFFGPSIFSDGHIWKEARGLVKPIFAMAEISDMEHLASFMDRFMDLLPNDETRALQQTTNAKPEPDFPAVRRRYVLLDEMAKHIRDPIKPRYHVLGVFNPARDTISIAVGNTLFQLARHPHIWTKLRKTSLEIDEPLTFEKLKSLVDLDMSYKKLFVYVGPQHWYSV
ncbi:71e7a536-2767-4abd-a573-fa59dc2a9e71 [Sclerotinia trifoliorum]|uniref:71e7a536-2767-4abd-a573-fa59dc2a9e71 n=1 Tax=Sclerotinia trifoliorum TaxID=28548 RepID=A0A8H2VR71_9HELO|nr:71e7a536-2767-4abd-a573-fa59dc2a9e71 [Sclerotinia trifoliorum]